MSTTQLIYKVLSRAGFALLFISILNLGACTSPSIKATGEPKAMSHIAGEWKGEYNSESSGKFGIIEFNLTKGADGAHGQVLMQETLGAHSLQQPLVTTYFRPLAIEFVHAGDTMIHGEVAPYKDLKRNVTIHTRFKGRVMGNIMQGTYFSTIQETNQSYMGKWKVTRQ